MAGILQQEMLTRFEGKACFPCEKWKSPLKKGFQNIPRGSAEWCRPKMCLCLAAQALPLGVPVSSCPAAPPRVFDKTMGFPRLMTQWCVKTSFSRETQRGKQKHASVEGHPKAGEGPSRGSPLPCPLWSGTAWVIPVPSHGALLPAPGAPSTSRNHQSTLRALRLCKPSVCLFNFCLIFFNIDALLFKCFLTNMKA